MRQNGATLLDTGCATMMMDFLDEQRMCRLYEKFILEYYKKHYPQIKTAASQIDWALDDGIGTMLPTMQSDIMLSDTGFELRLRANRSAA